MKADRRTGVPCAMPFHLRVATRLAYLLFRQVQADLYDWIKRLESQALVYGLIIGPGIIAALAALPMVVASILDGTASWWMSPALMATLGLAALPLRGTLTRADWLMDMRALALPRWVLTAAPLLALGLASSWLYLLMAVGLGLTADLGGMTLVRGVAVVGGGLAVQRLVLHATPWRAVLAMAVVLLAATWGLHPKAPLAVTLALPCCIGLPELLARWGRDRQGFQASRCNSLSIAWRAVLENGLVGPVVRVALALTVMGGTCRWMLADPLHALALAVLGIGVGSVLLTGLMHAVTQWFSERQDLIGALPLEPRRIIAITVGLPGFFQGICIMAALGTGMWAALDPLRLLVLVLLAFSLCALHLALEFRYAHNGIVLAIISCPIGARLAALCP